MDSQTCQDGLGSTTLGRLIEALPNLAKIAADCPSFVRIAARSARLALRLARHVGKMPHTTISTPSVAGPCHSITFTTECIQMGTIGDEWPIATTADAARDPIETGKLGELRTSSVGSSKTWDTFVHLLAIYTLVVARFTLRAIRVMCCHRYPPNHQNGMSIGVELTAKGGRPGAAIVARGTGAQVDPCRIHARLATTTNKRPLVCTVCAGGGGHPDVPTLAVVQVARLAGTQGGKHRVMSNKIRLIVLA